MKKMLMPLLEMVIIFLVTAFVTRPAYAEVQIPEGLYPNVGIVTEITEREVIKNVIVWEVTVTDSEDHMWKYFDDANDLAIGDMMALMMFDEYETPENVLDDIIVDARYVGVIDFYR